MFLCIYFRGRLNEEAIYRAGIDTWSSIMTEDEPFFFFFFSPRERELSGKELSFIIKITWVAFIMVIFWSGILTILMRLKDV